MEQAYFIEWKDMDKSPDIDATVIAAIQVALDKVYADGHSNDLVNVQVDHPALDHPIHIGYSKTEKLNAINITLQIKKTQQSKRDLNFESGLRLTFGRISLPKGGRPSEK